MARNVKINKVTEDIEKTKTHINELQTKLKHLEQQKIDIENVEIIGIVRCNNISADELEEVIKLIKNNKINEFNQ